MKSKASTEKKPSLLRRAYRSVIKPVVIWGALASITLGPYAVGENTVMAGGINKTFPFPETYSWKAESWHQPGEDYSHFGFALTEMKDGEPVFGDQARAYIDEMPDGTTRTNAGVRIPFDFGPKGKLSLYGLDHGNDEGLGARLRALYNDWIFSGVLEEAELGGDSQGLKGLGIGRMFHSNLGKTTLELWGYDKIGERFGNIFLFQDFPDGYQGGILFTGGHKNERDLSASFGRSRKERSWRIHTTTGLDGERYCIGGSVIQDPDPRFAVIPIGWISTEAGARGRQELWRNAMGYYPYQKIFEKGRFVLHVDYFHNAGSERVSTKASVRPFDLLNSDSELLRGIHIDGGYDWRDSDASGHNDNASAGFGIHYRGMNFYVEKPEGKEPVFGAQLTKRF